MTLIASVAIGYTLQKRLTKMQTAYETINPTPHPKHPGFYLVEHLGLVELVALSPDGRAMDLTYDHEIFPEANPDGQMMLSVRDGTKNHSYKLHRLLALVFLPRPIELANTDYNLLQVLHLDGPSLDLGNLYWRLNPQQLNTRHTARPMR